MKHLKVIAIPLYLLLLSSSSCKKSTLSSSSSLSDQMPPYTENGANTFACKINGKIWVNGGGDLIQDNISGGYNPSTKLFGVGGGKTSSGIEGDIWISNVPNVTGVGTFNFGGKNGGQAQYYYQIPDNKDYLTDSIYNGNITLKKCDLKNKIYSGTFSFDAKLVGGSEVVHITDGQFDFKQQ